MEKIAYTAQCQIVKNCFSARQHQEQMLDWHCIRWFSPPQLCVLLKSPTMRGLFFAIGQRKFEGTYRDIRKILTVSTGDQNYLRAEHGQEIPKRNRR